MREPCQKLTRFARTVFWHIKKERKKENKFLMLPSAQAIWKATR
jgi:hypothetical protein